MLHGFPEHDTVIGESGHIGRGAAIHRCAIRPNALVGINAVIIASVSGEGPTPRTDSRVSRQRL